MSIAKEPLQTVENQEVVLVPCSGPAIFGRERGHAYRIKIWDPTGKSTDGGFLDSGEALRRYPDAIISASDTMCPSCMADNERLKIIRKARTPKNT